MTLKKSSWLILILSHICIAPLFSLFILKFFLLPLQGLPLSTLGTIPLPYRVYIYLPFIESSSFPIIPLVPFWQVEMFILFTLPVCRKTGSSGLAALVFCTVLKLPWLLGARPHKCFRPSGKQTSVLNYNLF